MLGVMYTISKDETGVILVCHDCPHIERVNEFDGDIGKRRTQAAQEMLKHARIEHNGRKLVPRRDESIW